VSIAETILTFVGAPAAIILVVSFVVVGPAEMRAPDRYRPGRPWNHDPAWFLPHPAAVASSAPTSRARAQLGASRPALAAGDETAAAKITPVGGATGEW
jgi:hypothetical protein